MQCLHTHRIQCNIIVYRYKIIYNAILLLSTCINTLMYILSINYAIRINSKSSNIFLKINKVYWHYIQ